MKISNVASIVNTKIDASILTTHTYISTECMLPNCGGIENCSSIPNGKVTSFDKNDILLSNIRPYFKKLWFSTRSGGCSNDVICLRVANRECLPKYLYYALCTDKFIDSFSASSKGTKMPRGDKNALLTYEIPDRNIEDQLHIVDILGSIDKKIENNEQEIRKINDLALCFIAKSNNLNTELKPYIKFIKGKKPIENGSTTAPYLSIDAITSFRYESVYSDDMIMATPFDILMVMDGASSGTVFSHQAGVVSSTIAKIDCSDNIKDYLYWYLLSLKEIIKSRNTGSAIPHANKEYISSLKFDYGFATDIKTINILHSLRTRIIQLQEENKKLQELKGLYLKKFFK